MIVRCFDPAIVNDVINAETVSPWLKPDGVESLDVSELLENDRNYCFMSEFGGFLFVEAMPNLYELHSFFTPEKGGSVLTLFNSAISQMFLNSGCVEIFTYIPDDNIAAMKAVEKTGFRHMFSMPRWPKNGEILTAHHFTMNIHDWAAREIDLANVGEWFHEDIGEENTNHGHIDAHDLYVGAALTIAINGMPDKAEWFYNKWAAISGFEKVEMISAMPLTFRISDKKYIVTDHVEVSTCQ